jgi:thiol-disulfide isomerase/thioredoxin
MNRTAAAGLILAGAITLTACGSEQGGVETAPSAAPAQTSAPPSVPVGPSASGSEPGEGPTSQLPALSPESIVPQVPVVDVRSGETVDLGAVVPAATPVLLWAWAPHCPSCRAEAPEVEAFAAEQRGRIEIVGMGTQDDLDYARDFLADTGVSTPRMLWDPSFESWQALGIRAQPTFILVNGDGSFVQGWVGAFPRDELLSLLDG